MSKAVSRRIVKETQRLLKEPVPGISCTPFEDNIRHFKVVIAGPVGTPYEGGIFKIELFLPIEYPMSPPKVRFLTKIYHPNIDRVGRICLDILKDKWSPALQIKSVCLSLQCLLQSPNPEDPLANDVAEHWLSNEDGAMKTASEWTARYANAPPPGSSSVVTYIVSVTDNSADSIKEVMSAEKTPKRKFFSDEKDSAPVSMGLTESQTKKLESEFSEKQNRGKYRWESNKKREHSKSRKGRKKFRKKDQECWFCFSNPKLEQHLVIHIGEEAYLAAPKGAMHPDHALVIPIQHVSFLPFSDEKIKEEVEDFKRKLTLLCSDKKNIAVFSERYLSSHHKFHAYVEMLPVPETHTPQALLDHFQKCAEACGFQFNVLQDDEEEEDEIFKDTDGSLKDYFCIEFRGKRLMFCRGEEERNVNVSLNFVRQAVCDLIGEPSKGNWRDCAIAQSEEIEIVSEYKKTFGCYN